MSIKAFFKMLIPHFDTTDFAASQTPNGNYRLEKTLKTAATDEHYDAVITVKELRWLGLSIGVNGQQNIKPFRDI